MRSTVELDGDAAVVVDDNVGGHVDDVTEDGSREQRLGMAAEEDSRASPRSRLPAGCDREGDAITGVASLGLHSGAQTRTLPLRACRDAGIASAIR